MVSVVFFFFQAEDGIRDADVTGVQTCALPISLADGSSIRTRCVIWGGGIMAPPVAGTAGLPQGRGGRIDVQPDLTVDGAPGVYVIGEVANIPSPDGQSHPQLGSVALQSG